MTAARLPQRNDGATYGVCPVCRTRQRTVVTTGKLGKHGRTAAAPRGCAGNGQAPLRTVKRDGGGEVVPLRAGEPELRLVPRQTRGDAS
ncbi:hypothetical protein [Micromonospora sp. NPDC049645]|uniref:hypothetical protein n=1 Tax=Micromonospora sp. NPDC049645 TaxID=3155508 RepID=UPI003421E49A